MTKELKYGLMTKRSIEIYELGFSDREIAKEISDYFRKISKYIQISVRFIIK